MKHKKEQQKLRSSYISGLLSLSILALVLFAGCDSDPTEVDDYRQEPVVFSYLDTGKPFDIIHLEWAAKNIEAFYDPMDYVIQDVDLRIFSTINEITGDSILPGDGDYQEVSFSLNQHLGVYEPMVISGDNEVKQVVRYRLEAVKPGEVNLWAETVTPDTFTVRITNNSPDPRYAELDWQVQNDYNPQNPEILPNDLPSFSRGMDIVEIEWSRGWRTEANEGGQIMNLVALADTADLHRLDPDWDPLDPDDEIEPEEKGRGESTLAPPYQEMMDVVWIFYEFIGPHRMDVISASYEYYRYSFTSMNNLPHPESYVHGGLGCFSGISMKSYYMNMLKEGVKIYLPTMPVNYAFHNFGEVPVNTTVNWDSRILSMGSINLEIESMALEGDESFNFELRTNTPAPWSVEGGRGLEFQVRCTPASPQRIHSEIVIRSNDPYEPMKRIPLVVTGVN